MRLRNSQFCTWRLGHEFALKTSTFLLFHQDTYCIDQIMRLAPSFFWLIGLTPFFCSFTAIPTVAHPIVARAQVCEPEIFDLGGGWTFCFTTLPSLFYPIDEAAERLDSLYEHVKITAIQTSRNAGSLSKYSDSLVFLVGRFALIFTGNFDDAYDSNWKAAVIWPAIAVFCDKMQGYVRRGEVLLYSGVIESSGAGGGLTVQLRLLGGT